MATQKHKMHKQLFKGYFVLACGFVVFCDTGSDFQRLLRQNKHDGLLRW